MALGLCLSSQRRGHEETAETPNSDAVRSHQNVAKNLLQSLGELLSTVSNKMLQNDNIRVARYVQKNTEARQKMAGGWTYELGGAGDGEEKERGSAPSETPKEGAPGVRKGIPCRSPAQQCVDKRSGFKPASPLTNCMTLNN